MKAELLNRVSSETNGSPCQDYKWNLNLFRDVGWTLGRPIGPWNIGVCPMPPFFLVNINLWLTGLVEKVCTSSLKTLCFLSEAYVAWIAASYCGHSLLARASSKFSGSWASIDSSSHFGQIFGSVSITSPFHFREVLAKASPVPGRGSLVTLGPSANLSGSRSARACKWRIFWTLVSSKEV